MSTRRAARIINSVLPELKAAGRHNWEAYVYLREIYGINIICIDEYLESFEIIDTQKYLFYLMKYPLD